MRQIWKLISPYWVSSEKYKAIPLFILIIILSLLSVYGAVLLNEWNSGFYNALQALDQNLFKQQCIRFIWLAVFVISIFLLNYYVKSLLVFRWRKWLTEYYLNRWLRYHNHYRLQFHPIKTDNPDQRISQDLASFTEGVINLTTEIFRNAISFISFVGILWVLSGPLKFDAYGYHINIPGYMVWAALLYSIFGTLLVFKMGKPIVKLDFDQEKFEANFRYSLVRLREQSEEVAIYKGHEAEEKNFNRSFSKIVENFYRILKQQMIVACCQNFYNNASVIFPFVAAAPLFFTKIITLGILMQMRSAFSEVQSSLSFFLNSFSSIASLRATTQRLTGFSETLDSLENDHNSHKIEKNNKINNREQIEKNNKIENNKVENNNKNTITLTTKERIHLSPNINNTLIIDNLTLTTPEGKILLNNFNIKVNQSDKILIMGRSGLGKSTLLRAISGVWTFGIGNIHYPSGVHFMLIPQRPYSPLGTLRDTLIYPIYQGMHSYTDEELIHLLQLCRLNHLVDALDQINDWSRQLSLGEQQRIIFARILLHKPDWVMMDEPSSAMDKESEQLMFELLAEYLPQLTIITIGHSPTLRSYHDKVILMDSLEESEIEMTS